MVRQVMSVFDRASMVFGTPFFVVAVGAGTRSFRDEVNRKADDNSIYQHPEDYELFHLGSFDDETGLFSASSANGVLGVVKASDCFDFERD